MEKQILERLCRIEHYCSLASKSLLNINDVALLLNVSKSTIYRLTSRHQIPFYKNSLKSIYFDKNEVEAWAKGMHNTSETEDSEARLNLIRRKMGLEIKKK